MVDNNVFWGYPDLPSEMRGVYPPFGFGFVLFSLKSKVILILQGGKVNGVKILAVQLWAAARRGSALLTALGPHPFVLVGEPFVASSAGSAGLSRLIACGVLGQRMVLCAGV